MAITIKDIAKSANVSPSTVSRVLDGSPRISSETSAKIKNVMREMDYHPNMLARSLARRNTKIVGTLMPGTKENAFQHLFFPEILRGITSQAHKDGYNILISSAATPREEKDVINDFSKNGMVEGLILMTSRHNDTIIRELTEMSFPFVLVGNPEKHRNITWVDNDNVEAGRKLANHFISRGYRKIAFIGLSDKYLVVKDRFEGYRQALAESGIEFSEKLVVKGAFMEGKGSAMMEELLSKKVPFNGVIAADDIMAFDAIKVLGNAGFQVPGNVAVAGFNNLKLSEYFSPTLTSVDINAFELGAKAFRLVHSEIEQKDFKPTHSFVDVKIMTRESTDHQFIYQP